jgi:hypothetical protein
LTTPAEGETVPTMRLTWDQLAKEIIPSVLAGVGHVQTSVEAQTDTQFVDLYVTPENDVDWTEAFQRLGWLAKMAQQSSIIEPYSTTVRVSDVRQCLRKQLTLSHSQGKAEEEMAEVPFLWIPSAGDARQATEGFELRARDGWPQGFRFAAPALELCVIVLSELPKQGATLPLRLLGRGATLRQAVEEVRMLPEADPMRRPMVEVLAQHRFAELHFSVETDPGEAEMLQQEFQKFKEQVREEGREEGQRRLVRHLLEKKFGPLDETANARLEGADDAALEQYAERLLIADTLAAVFSD